jgi:tetratricopeptide (TPR) repeat protein
MRSIIVLVGVSAAVALFAATEVMAQMPGGMPGGMGGGGMGGRPMSQPSDQADSTPHDDKPDVAAQKWYKQGAKSLSKAMDYDAAAARASTPDKRASELEKASDSYYRALDLYTEALVNDADMADAWDSVGYIHLRLGAYVESVDDYDHTLKLRPDAEEAIERRAEAYLHLDRIDEARSAYMELFNHSRPLADQLMASMQRWVAEHRPDPKGMRPAQVDGFDSWLQERAKLAEAPVAAGG